MRLAAVLLVGLFATPAAAETIDVKYQGPVPLSSYACEDIVRSTVVNRVCYDGSSERMIVRLKTTYYLYCRIPQPVVAEFLAAPSMGRFYNERIKSDAIDGLYACKD